MKRVILINFIIIVILCCSSNKTVTKKPQNYICLDAITLQKQMKGYELKIPDSWCSYIGFHDSLSHSPKSLTNLKESYFKNQLIVLAYNNATYRSKGIEEALEKHFVLLNSSLVFAPVFSSDVHETYGKYYIVKYKAIQHGENLLNLEVLFNFNNQDYIIRYSVLEEQYNKFENEVIQIISSFKIIEN